jgi:hypothetical protein
MSQENVEVVRRVMEARVRGDAEAALANARRARLRLGPALLDGAAGSKAAGGDVRCAGLAGRRREGRDRVG